MDEQEQADALIRELRKYYCLRSWTCRHQPDRKVRTPEAVKAGWQVRQARRRWRKRLFESSAFRSAAVALCHYGIQDRLTDVLLKLYAIRIWRIRPVDVSPRELANDFAKQTETQQHIAATLDAIANDLAWTPANQVRRIAQRVRSDRLALARGNDGIGAVFHYDNVSKRGGGTDTAGQWRAWYVREVAELLPCSFPERYATIAQLLKFSGVRVSAAYVRSLLMRGHT